MSFDIPRRSILLSPESTWPWSEAGSGMSTWIGPTTMPRPISRPSGKLWNRPIRIYDLQSPRDEAGCWFTGLAGFAV